MQSESGIADLIYRRFLEELARTENAEDSSASPLADAMENLWLDGRWRDDKALIELFEGLSEGPA